MSILKDLFSIVASLPLHVKVLFILLTGLKAIAGIFGPQIKGFIGEMRVKNVLKDLPNDEYLVLNDIMIRNDYGTAQIDHIIVSRYGIFVLETKNYRGWIHGKEFDDQWRLNIYRYKRNISNPVKQNYGHVQSLKKLLADYDIPFYSIVVFTGSAKLKNILSNTPVIYSKQLKKTISTLASAEVINNEKMNHIQSIILNNNLTDAQTRKQHNENIKNAIANNHHNADEINTEICPRCSSHLVKRKGPHSEFWGCSSFPKCRFTRNIDVAKII